MKKQILLICLVLASIYGKGQHAIIPLEQLPEYSQYFLSQHFPMIKVSNVMIDTGRDTTYTAIVGNEAEVEFDKFGYWTDVEMRSNDVPHTIVPDPITNYVLNNHANQRIVKIERDETKYLVLLSNGMELKFNGLYQLYEIDD